MKSLISKLSTSESVIGFGLLLPNFLGFLIFTFLPVLLSLALSFVKWDMLSPPQFVGFANFVALLGFHREAGHLVANDPRFWQYLYNTFYFLANVPLCMIGSLVVALIMNQKLKGITVFRTTFFLPTICAGVAICLLWKWILNENGLLNAGLLSITTLVRYHHFEPFLWLTDPALAKASIMMMQFWGTIGGMNMLLYLAALQGVPTELYEAAELDGANGWRKFWAVTVPFISPTSLFVLIMGIISGFQGEFMQLYVMTRGGPAGSTTTVAYYIYNNAYQWYKMGYASSIAWSLFLVILLVTWINWRLGGKLVHY